jgi:hypothetical protein
MAWLHISCEVTVKGFKRCCIFITFSGTDYDMLWSGSEKDGNVSGCEEDESTGCDNGDSDTGW